MESMVTVLGSYFRCPECGGRGCFRGTGGDDLTAADMACVCGGSGFFEGDAMDRERAEMRLEQRREAVRAMDGAPTVEVPALTDAELAAERLRLLEVA